MLLSSHREEMMNPSAFEIVLVCWNIQDLHIFLNCLILKRAKCHEIVT